MREDSNTSQGNAFRQSRKNGLLPLHVESQGRRLRAGLLSPNCSTGADLPRLLSRFPFGLGTGDLKRGYLINPGLVWKSETTLSSLHRKTVFPLTCGRQVESLQGLVGEAERRSEGWLSASRMHKGHKEPRSWNDRGTPGTTVTTARQLTAGARVSTAGEGAAPPPPPSEPRGQPGRRPAGWEDRGRQ